MSLFRQSALDALSNPEKLDQPQRLLRPRQWLLLLSLGGFSLSILTWSVLGRLPVREPRPQKVRGGVKRARRG